MTEERSEPPEDRAAAPAWYDSWELEEQLEHIRRVLGVQRPEDKVAFDRPAIRLDLPHNEPRNWHAGKARLAKREGRDGRQRGHGAGVVIASFLTTGMICFVCGIFLLGWSLYSGRQELWTVGLPIALVGQIGLLVAFIAQLDRLWHENHCAAIRLRKVDEQLHALRTAATLLHSAHTPDASSFYSHFVHGASPQLLLADLKSQLDLLALRITRDER